MVGSSNDFVVATTTILTSSNNNNNRQASVQQIHDKLRSPSLTFQQYNCGQHWARWGDTSTRYHHLLPRDHNYVPTNKPGLLSTPSHDPPPPPPPTNCLFLGVSYVCCSYIVYNYSCNYARQLTLVAFSTTPRLRGGSVFFFEAYRLKYKDERQWRDQ